MTAHPPDRVRRLRRESAGFLIGSALFAVGAVPAYASAVGPVWSSATFFAGSVFFTIGGLTQFALSGRRPPRTGSSAGVVSDWWSALIQFLGTLLFNISTLAVLVVAAASPPQDWTGWRPDAWGSIAFLISSALAMVAASKRHELWDPEARTWHGTILNMLGSIAFGFSAVGAYVVPATDELLNLAWANGGTFVGAVCFFVAALLARRFITPIPPQEASAPV